MSSGGIDWRETFKKFLSEKRDEKFKIPPEVSIGYPFLPIGATKFSFIRNLEEEKSCIEEIKRLGGTVIYITDGEEA